jgi:hypothetical protein
VEVEIVAGDLAEKEGRRDEDERRQHNRGKRPTGKILICRGTQAKTSSRPLTNPRADQR